MLTQTPTNSIQPVSNTGSECQSSLSISFNTHPHWLQGILYTDNIEETTCLMDILVSCAGDKMIWEENNPFTVGIKWNNCFKSVLGVMFAYNLPESDGLPFKCLISFPGRYWDNIPTLVDCWDIFRTLGNAGFRSTVCHTALNDYSKFVTYEMLEEAANNGDYSGVKMATPIYNLDNKFPGIKFGWTWYFGSSNSDKRLKIYDKNAESKGKIDAIRWEVEYKDDRAQNLFNQFVNCVEVEQVFNDRDSAEELLGLFLASVVTGAVTFSDKDSNPRADRRQLLPWFEYFIESIAHGIKISTARPEPTADSRIRWLFKQVSTAYETIRQVLGKDFWKFEEEFQRLGKRKMKPTHKAFVDVSKQFYPTYRTGVYCTIW